jgi:hypothetical protein
VADSHDEVSKVTAVFQPTAGAIGVTSQVASVMKRVSAWAGDTATAQVIPNAIRPVIRGVMRIIRFLLMKGQRGPRARD